MDAIEVYSICSILMHYNKLPTNDVRDTNMKNMGNLGEIREFGWQTDIPI